jgi:hypothetical protein
MLDIFLFILDFFCVFIYKIQKSVKINKKQDLQLNDVHHVETVGKNGDSANSDEGVSSADHVYMGILCISCI